MSTNQLIPLHRVLVADDALEKIKPTLFSGLLTEGPRVKEFEALLSEYLGVPVLATNSCTSAIDLALHLCGVGPGDSVVSTPLTCIATTVGVARRGAQLVWADVDPETGLIDPQSVAERVTVRTKAILVVDWGGRPVDCGAVRTAMHAVKRLAWPTEERGYGYPWWNNCIPVIQDAAHSFGARLPDATTPAHSHANMADYTAWSFQPIKHLTCSGDGGALHVPPGQCERARRLRWFGIDRETKVKFRFLQDVQEAGYKYHLDDLSAALGIANFPVAVKAVETHRLNAQWLHGALQECRVVKRPPPDPGSSWWFYSLRTPKPFEFVDFAEQRGVGAGPVHGRNDFYSCYDRGHHPLPGVDKYFAEHVAIPCGWWLKQEDLNRIADTVIAWDKTL